MATEACIQSRVLRMTLESISSLTASGGSGRDGEAATEVETEGRRVEAGSEGIQV